MNFLVLQSKGQNSANSEFKENWQRSLARLGHQVVTWGAGHSTVKQSFEALVTECDVILCLEDYGHRSLPPLHHYKKLKIFVSMDSHLALNAHINFCRTQRFDIVITALKRHVKDFKVACKRPYYLPNAYPSDLMRPFGDKLHGLGFCGNVANRGSWLNKLDEMGLHRDIMVIGNSMAKAISSYKIHFNRNISYDINCRTFETLGCGTFLLTNDTEGLSDIYTIGKHLVTYDSIGDCRDKITYYLKNESEREEIAAAGHKHSYEQHTYDRRAQQLMEIVG